VHAADRYLALAAAVDATVPVREFHISVPPQAMALAQSVLSATPRPRIVLHPFARWRTKLWELEGWRALARALLAEGSGLILTGSREDESAAGAILAGLDPSPLSLVGRLSLTQLTAVLREVDLMITVDSGPMHIAAAVGTPVVALFGPTDPRRTGPLGPGRVLRRELPCSPCLQRRCQIADTYRCMRDITVAEVLDAAHDLLQPRRGTPKEPQVDFSPPQADQIAQSPPPTPSPSEGGGVGWGWNLRNRRSSVRRPER
jgi:ADP-heptose:LPS heptosyltransferase